MGSVKPPPCWAVALAETGGFRERRQPPTTEEHDPGFGGRMRQQHLEKAQLHPVNCHMELQPHLKISYQCVIFSH